MLYLFTHLCHHANLTSRVQAPNHGDQGFLFEEPDIFAATW